MLSLPCVFVARSSGERIVTPSTLQILSPMLTPASKALQPGFISRTRFSSSSPMPNRPSRRASVSVSGF